MTKPDLIGHTPGTSVPVFVGSGLSRRLSQLMGRSGGGRRLALVTDTTVARLHGHRLRASLVDAGWKVDYYKLAPGERIKTERVVGRLQESWLRARYDRATPVVAFGGGTVGDAVGFAAATFMRGLPLWQIPTTVIGQVDSSLGGKVGVNHPRGKNLIGCFYQPTGIVIDPEFLATLPVREIRSGLAEVVKYGIIADPALFRRCERTIAHWISRSAAIDAASIRRCAAIKLKIVRADERDMGRRHILNFGHTLGHAFEAWGKFTVLRHGEAVTLGMVAASVIARQRGTLSAQDFERIRSLCQPLAPRLRASRLKSSAVLPYLATDKKRSAGQNAWVLPRQIGKVTIVRDVADKEIKAAVEFVRQWVNSPE